MLYKPFVSATARRQITEPFGPLFELGTNQLMASLCQEDDYSKALAE